jgi:hypothetical protein
MAWKEVQSGNTWISEKEGDSIEGELLAVREGSYGNKVYDVRLSDGEVTTVFGTVVLESLMAQASIGQKVKIEYVGLKPSKIKGRNPTKLFKVFLEE